MSIDLKSSYLVYYNSNNYGTDYKNISKLFNAEYLVHNIMLDKVPAIIDTRLSVIEDDNQIILFQEPIIFDLDDTNPDGYVLYKGKKNNIIFDKKEHKIINNDLDFVFETKSNIENTNLSIIINFLLQLIKLQNEKSYDLILNNLVDYNMRRKLENVYLSLIGLIKESDLLETFNDLWNTMPHIIFSNIYKENFIDLIKTEKKNIEVLSLSDKATEFLSLYEIADIPNNIDKITEEDWDLINKLNDITKSKFLGLSSFYSYNELLNSISNLLDYDYIIREVFEYIIKEKYLQKFEPSNYHLFNYLIRFSNYVKKMNDYGIDYRNKYPTNLVKTLKKFFNNEDVLKSFIKEVSMKNKKFSEIVNTNPEEELFDQLMKKEIDVCDNYKLFNIKGNILQVKTFKDFVKFFMCDYSIRNLLIAFINDENIFILSEDDNEIVFILDKNNKVTYKYNNFKNYNKELINLYYSL